jgi:hypothetical protein
MAKRNIRQKSTNAQAVLRHFSTTNQGNQMTKHVNSKAHQIRKYVAANPNAKAKDIAKELGVGISYVYTVMWTVKKKTKTKLPRKVLTLEKIKEATARVQEFIRSEPSQIEMLKQIEMFEPATDPVNHPAHYKVGGIETIDFIEAKKLGYNLGNVVKYLTRADHKGNRKQDLEKALWYLNREINSLK